MQLSERSSTQSGEQQATPAHTRSVSTRFLFHHGCGINNTVHRTSVQDLEELAHVSGRGGGGLRVCLKPTDIRSRCSGCGKSTST